MSDLPILDTMSGRIDTVDGKIDEAKRDVRRWLALVRLRELEDNERVSPREVGNTYLWSFSE